MSIPIRLRAPNGQHRLDVDPTATLRDLIGLIKEKTEVSKFLLKYSYPLKELDTSDAALSSSVQDLKLRGETMVVVPLDSPSQTATAQGAQRSADVQPPPKPFTAKPMEPDETVVEWPERGGYLGKFGSAYPWFSSGLTCSQSSASCRMTTVACSPVLVARSIFPTRQVGCAGKSQTT